MNEKALRAGCASRGVEVSCKQHRSSAKESQATLCPKHFISKKQGESSMVTSIARQSVIIKCNMQKSVLTGNYEFYYAAGLIAKLSGVEFSEDIKPIELGEFVHQEIEKTEPKDEQEKYLFSMLKDYKPTEEYDEQMKELLLWGKSEKYLWMVTVPEQG